MVNEKLTFTETRTIEVEGKENAERLRTFIERQGVRMNPPGELPVGEPPAGLKAGTKEPAPPEAAEERVEAVAETPATVPDEKVSAPSDVPKEPVDAQAKTPTTVTNGPEDKSMPDALPTPEELVRKAWDHGRGTLKMFRDDIDKVLTGPQATPEPDRAPKEPEDRQTG